MADTKQVLENIKNEVSKATQSLQKKHPGADLAQAKRLLSETAEAIRSNQFDKAIILAQRAQLAADPTTEYLLGIAKNSESQGTVNYQKQNYMEAIKSWQQSLREYENVCQLAKLRKEHEVLDQVIAVMATIEADVKAASTEKNSHEMFDLIVKANKEASDAKSLYSSGEFDKAVTRFNVANEKYSAAAQIAKENNFEDESRLNEAVSGMQRSIEACYLGKSREMLNIALTQKRGEKERSCTEVESYLKSFSSTSPLYLELQQQAFGGIAQAKMEVGINMMAEAEALYKKQDIYQAKEGYRRAQEYFNQVSDYTIEHHLNDQRKEVDRLIDACTINIRDTAVALSSRTPIVKLTPPKRVVDLEKGVQFETTSGIETHEKERMSQLEHELKGEYQEIKWLKPGGANYIAVAMDKSGNQVALRLPKTFDRNRQRTFLDESRAWENLRQRNIVKLIQTVVFPPLLELEYMEGGSLKDFLSRNPILDKKIACHITNDIARGLEYAHSKGVVHGDLKPSNILLTKALEAKISDWSVGKSYTPGYAAPEQIAARPADNKTDIYQLGIIFYEMVCGVNPFGHGSIIEIKNKTLNWNPDKLSQTCPELKSMDEMHLRCLAKDPNDRPTIREFRKAIYVYMKEFHGESLHSIQEGNAQTNELLELAMLAAKQNETTDLRDTLEELLSKVAGRKRVQDALPQMKYVKIVNVFNTVTKDGVTIFKPNITLPQHTETDTAVQDGIVNDIDTLVRSLEDA